MLVGSKSDLKHLRKVQKHEALEIARSRGCRSYTEVSAKESVNVEESFATLTELMWKHAISKQY